MSWSDLNPTCLLRVVKDLSSGIPNEIRCFPASFEQFFGGKFQAHLFGYGSSGRSLAFPWWGCNPRSRNQHTVHWKVYVENVLNPTCYSEFEYYSVSMKWHFTNVRKYSAIAVLSIKKYISISSKYIKESVPYWMYKNLLSSRVLYDLFLVCIFMCIYTGIYRQQSGCMYLKRDGWMHV